MTAKALLVSRAGEDGKKRAMIAPVNKLLASKIEQFEFIFLPDV